MTAPQPDSGEHLTDYAFPVRLRDRQHVPAPSGLGLRVFDHASSAASAHAAAVDVR